MGVFRLSVVAGLVVLTGVACAGDGTGLELVNEVDQVTLSDDVQPIFTSNCALSGCHAGTNPQQGMNLSVGQTKYAHVRLGFGSQGRLKSLCYNRLRNLTLRWHRRCVPNYQNA